MSDFIQNSSINWIPPFALCIVALAGSVYAVYVLFQQKRMPHKLFLIGMQLFNIAYVISLTSCSALFFRVFLKEKYGLPDSTFYFYMIELVPNILSGVMIYLLLMFDINLLDTYSVLDETRLTKSVIRYLRIIVSLLFVCLHGWTIIRYLYSMTNFMAVMDPITVFLVNISNVTSLVFFAIAMIADNCQMTYIISKIWDFNKNKSKVEAQKSYRNSVNWLLAGLFVEWVAISLYVFLFFASSIYNNPKTLHIWVYFFNTLAQCTLCIRMSMNPFLFLQLKKLTFAGRKMVKNQPNQMELKIGKEAPVSAPGATFPFVFPSIKLSRPHLKGKEKEFERNTVKSSSADTPNVALPSPLPVDPDEADEMKIADTKLDTVLETQTELETQKMS